MLKLKEMDFGVRKSEGEKIPAVPVDYRKLTAIYLCSAETLEEEENCSFYSPSGDGRCNRKILTITNLKICFNQEGL